MPFQSGKQRRYLWANEPEIARDWTNKYGSRIQRNGGGIMHQFENYAHEDGNNVSVPRSFQARPNSDQVNLAYITPQEQRILQSLKPGTPHRGPMEIPNYDSFDAAGNYTTSENIRDTGPKAGTARNEAQVFHGPGIGGQQRTTTQAQQHWDDPLNQANRQAVYESWKPDSGMRTQMYKPKSNFGIGNIFKGLGNKIFQGRGDYNNQTEWEQARQDRINKKRINRLRKTRDYGKYANNPQGWAGSDLSGRLTGLEKDVFGKDYVDYSRTTPKARDLKALRDQQALTSQLSAKDFINLDQSISGSGYKPRGFVENLQSKFGSEVIPAAAVKPDFLKQQSWYNSPLKLRQNTFSTALGENAQEKTQAFQELKSLVPRGTLTVEKYLDLAQQNKIPSILVEDMNKQVLEAIKKQGGFGDTFPKNYSLGNIKPTIKDGRIDIDETKIDDDYKDRLKYLEVAEGGLAGLWPR